MQPAIGGHSAAFAPSAHHYGHASLGRVLARNICDSASLRPTAAEQPESRALPRMEFPAVRMRSMASCTHGLGRELVAAPPLRLEKPGRGPPSAQVRAPERCNCVQRRRAAAASPPPQGRAAEQRRVPGRALFLGLARFAS